MDEGSVGAMVIKVSGPHAQHTACLPFPPLFSSWESAGFSGSRGDSSSEWYLELKEALAWVVLDAASSSLDTRFSYT